MFIMKAIFTLLALGITSISVAISQLSPQAAHASGPCADSCNLAQHRAATHQTMPMSHMVAMDMSTPTPRPAASSAAQPQSEPRGAAADTMMQSMNDQHMANGGHMQMTMSRAASADDRRRADEILAALRKAIEPYKDYRIAEMAGYKQFLPQVPQPMYHFTSWTNAYQNEFSFDPARPTSLMYKTVPGGYELVGAMYTAPARSTDDQLNARVPLSIATWHLHTNLCLPPADKRNDMWSARPQFGLAGSITTADACAQAGGTFKPVIYNWMVHVWPFETDPSKVWATEEHPGAMK